MMQHKQALPLLPILALLALGACSGEFDQHAREQFSKTVPSGMSPVVHIDNVAGEIAITGSDRASVRIEGTKFARTRDDLNNITIDVQHQNNDVFIKTSYASAAHGGGVRYTLAVPAHAAIEVENVAGTIAIDHIDGNVSVNTQAGTISADLGKVDGARTIDLSATTGTIRLSIAPGSNAMVSARSTVGDFSSNINGIERHRENVVGITAQGKVGSGSARIKLSTTTGAITLREHA